MNQAILNHLKTSGRITLSEAAKLDCFYLGKEISRIRKRYGKDTIVTSYKTVLTKHGYKRVLQYCVSERGKAVIWPVKKPWKSWITAYR